MSEVANQLAQRTQHQYYGKYRGIVHDNADPLNLGRLQLIIPSVFVCDTDAITDWAWPCLPCGGASDQGFFFIPDIGAKVWVEFEEGNLDLPVWVGTFWSGPDGDSEIPVEAQTNTPQRRVLKTSSGHVLEFCDVEGEESITIRHKDEDGARLVLDEKGSVTISNRNGSLIYLNADQGEVTIVGENGNNVLMNSSGMTLTNQDGSVVDLAGEAVQVIAKNVHLRSETVSLGEGAMEPALLGLSFAAMYDAHVHPTALGPSGPPIPAPMPLSAPTNPAVSKVVKVK